VALPGSGIIPPAGGLYNELTAVTRRGFVPRLFVQFGFASPTWFNLIGGAQRAAGGLAPITVPVQGQPMVSGQFTNYAGSFNAPPVIPGNQAAAFPTQYWVVPVPLPFGERIIQATDTVISLLKARMNDVWLETVQSLSPLLFSNNTANPALPNSFFDGFDNGTVNGITTYGGINRTTGGTPSWQGQSIQVPSVVQSNGFTRATLQAMILQVQDGAGGELPTYGIMAPGDFATLNKDFVGAELINVYPGSQVSGLGTAVRSAFPNLNVSGVPIYADHWCPQGIMILVNKRYTNMYLAEDGAFDFSGFYSLVPVNQIGQQGVMVLGYNVLTAKPSANAWLYGIGNPAFTVASYN
jgi:hypothetical protein